MKLYLVRHGLAEPLSASGLDANRALTAEGRENMRREAEGLKKIGVKLDRILASPLRRARETAKILGEGLGGVQILEADALSSGADPRTILEALEPHRRLSSLALVGHEPDLGHLASVLLSGSAATCPLPFRAGAIACFGVELVPGAQRSQLEWFLTPDQLDRLASS